MVTDVVKEITDLTLLRSRLMSFSNERQLRSDNTGVVARNKTILELIYQLSVCQLHGLQGYGIIRLMELRDLRG